MPLAKDVELEDLSKKTIGYTGADIEALVREAALLALREDMETKQVKKSAYNNEFLVVDVGGVVQGESGWSQMTTADGAKLTYSNGPFQFSVEFSGVDGASRLEDQRQQVRQARQETARKFRKGWNDVVQASLTQIKAVNQNTKLHLDRIEANLQHIRDEVRELSPLAENLGISPPAKLKEEAVQSHPLEPSLMTTRLTTEGVEIRNGLSEVTELRESTGDEILHQKLDVAELALFSADQSFGGGDPSSGEFWLNIGRALIDHVKTVLDVGTGFVPGINDARDFYELTCGKDLFSGENIGLEGRTLSALGLLIGSGALYRNIAHSVKSLLPVGDRIGKKAVETALQAAARSEGNFSEIKKAASLLKKYDVGDDSRREVIEAFNRGTKAGPNSHSRTLRRYYIEGTTLPRNKWLTEIETADPYNDLVLPKKGEYIFKEWQLPAGADIIEGPIAPFKGRKPLPGATQVYVLDENILKELK